MPRGRRAWLTRCRLGYETWRHDFIDTVFYQTKTDFAVNKLEKQTIQNAY